MYPPAEHTTTEMFCYLCNSISINYRQFQILKISTSAPRLFSQGKQVVNNMVGLKMEEGDGKGVRNAGTSTDRALSMLTYLF